MFRTAILFAVGWAFVCHEQGNATLQTTSGGIMEKSSAFSGWNSGRIKGPDGYIYYEDNGTGSIPVVLLHSFGGSSIHWKAQVEHLQKDRRVVTIDLRGHGKSDTSATQDYSVESQAKDVAALTDSLGLTRFVLVGHSMGGSVAIAYADRHPEKVAGLLLAGTPGKTTAEQSRPVIASLRAYPGPRLIISTSQENQPNALKNQVPGIPSRTIDGTSHWMQMDKPEEFNRILDEFLETVGNKGN